MSECKTKISELQTLIVYVAVNKQQKFAHYLNDIDRFDISSKGPLSGISIDVVTERINIILINLGGVMSVLGFASTAGQVSIQPVKLIDPFY